MSENTYSVTLKIQPTLISGGIGHAFITLTAPGRSDVTVGYYPVATAPYAVAVERHDSVSGESATRNQNLATPHAFMPY